MICEHLDKVGIRYSLYTHEAVYTIDDVKNAKLSIPGIGTKNLFLKDKTNKCFVLFISEDDKKVDLKKLASKIGSRHLSFASAQELSECMGLELGYVGPLGVVNDRDCRVKVVFDTNIEGKEKLNVSANSHTVTLTIDYCDLCKFIEIEGNKFTVVSLDEQIIIND